MPQTKPHLNILTLGQIDHGKTTLTAAITLVLAKQGLAEAKSYDVLSKPPEVKVRDIFLHKAEVSYETQSRCYTHAHCNSNVDIQKYLLSSVSKMDGAILVVAATDGLMQQTREHINLAHKVGIQKVVVFLNKVDLFDDEDVVELVELETRELLNKYGFDGDNTPFIRGSALKAFLWGWDDAAAEEPIKELLTACDNYFNVAKPLADRPFFMPIQKTLTNTEQNAIIITGCIERGAIEAGDKVDIYLWVEGSYISTVTAITTITDKYINYSRAGDTVNLWFPRLSESTMEHAAAIFKHDSIKLHSKIRCEVYVLTKKEGGRHSPFFNGFRPEFLSLTQSMMCVCSFPEDTERVMPGDFIDLTINFIFKIPIEIGTYFSLREGGKVTVVGKVTKIIE